MIADLSGLRAGWTADDPSGVGRDIYRAVPDDQRPDWAGAILLYITGEVFDCEVLSRLVGLSFDDRRWPEATGLFHEIRALTLDNERSGREGSLEQLVLMIGETAAKVIANTSRTAAFDFNAGWRMAPRLALLAAAVNRPDFTERCWHLLIRRPHLSARR